MLKRTIVYVDGFNLYYGCLRNTPYRWLDLSKLCNFLLPSNDIIEIKYFTARVKPHLKDKKSHIRQKAYLRALETIPNIKIIYGHFLRKPVRMPLSENTKGKTEYVKVIKTEEKGSDVNLAVHLLNDAHLDLFDVGVIISNDSDLYTALEFAGNLGKIIGILNPHPIPSQKLKSGKFSFYKPIREGVLKVSQFPETLKDKIGKFSKPEGW
ncbi:MAG: NYN domain-containing protein [Planctomycetes bacterium]|nr:NYN domain-containing protein [Planctomycetota bacterium]